MKTEKLNEYQIRVPKKKAFIDTPENELPLHQLNICVGRRGGGKTVCISSKLKDLQEQGLADRIFCVSPTLGSNKSILEMLKIADGDMYSKPNRHSLKDIVEKIEEEGKEWREYEEKMKKYIKLKKMLEKGTKSIMVINDLWQFWGLGDELEPPKSKYGHFPVCHIFLDDCIGTDAMSVSKESEYYNLCLRHRHIGTIGCSLWQAAQVYIGQSNSIPPAIRQNCTTLCLFKTRDTKAVNKIAEEVCADIDINHFLKAFEYATEGDHNFLCIDFDCKKPHMRFRKNWNEFIIFNEGEENT